MKILHCCLANFYVDNYGYQENILPKQNKLDGHDVSILASTETYLNDDKLGYVEPRKYINEDGIPVTRVPYKKILTKFITRKFRSYKGVYKILEEENPDVILFHDTCAWELLTVAKYKKKHSHVKLFVDSHTDANNSATNFFSKNILHRIFYKMIARIACRHIDKILCISLETQDFLNTIYGISEDKLEFYPLGGVVLEDKEYLIKREKIRTALSLGEDDILLVHAGKLDKHKRTAEILEAFSKVESKKLRLVILGSFPEDQWPILMPMIQADHRVSYEGWGNAEELVEYLCAADMYVQPGSQSATMQNAICCRCSVMLYPHRSHEPYLKGNGYFVKTVEDMVVCFKSIVDQPQLLKQMSTDSLKIAHDLLDYRKLASRLYQ
jgi:glycosyltransferase involved in cell wall biosynthesis